MTLLVIQNAQISNIEQYRNVQEKKCLQQIFSYYFFDLCPFVMKDQDLTTNLHLKNR